MIWPFRKREQRAITQGDNVVFLDLAQPTKSDQIVTTETALGLLAVWAAVNFISGTIAGLPLHVYERGEDGRERVSGGIATILHDNVSAGQTSYSWRKYTFERVLTGGRAFTYINRNRAGRVSSLVPLDPGQVDVERRSGELVYTYTEAGSRRVFTQSEIIDLTFMSKPDGVGHWGPISCNRDAIGCALAVQEYAAKFFGGGGVPHYAVMGNFQSGDAMRRASDDLAAAIRKASKEHRQVITMPDGLDMKPLGVDPEKAQFVEVQRFHIEQIARIYSLPPTFLQDLTHGTFSNTEQQDLHFVKHTLKRWIEQFEAELNLKLFGPGAGRFFVEFSVDGLLRGDIKTRMEAHASAIQNGIYSPSYAAGLENAPHRPEGDRLMIQGATVPIEQVDGQGTPKGRGPSFRRRVVVQGPAIAPRSS